MKKGIEKGIIMEAPCGIFMTDRETNITFWNDDMEKLSGISSEYALKQKLSFVKFYNINPLEKKLLDFRECFRGKKTNVAKTAFIENSSHVQTLVFLNARFIEVDNEQKLMVIVTDISREITCNTVSATPLIVKEKEALQRIVGRDEKIMRTLQND